MKVIQVVPRLAVESAGTSHSVPALCGGLADAGCNVTLCSTGANVDGEFPFEVKVFAESGFLCRKLGRSRDLLKFLQSACAEADVICSNSLWMMPNVYPSWAKRRTRCKLVSAPRGTMSKWAWTYHWPQKKIFGLYAQYEALHATDMWHATAVGEYDDIRRLNYRQPVMILPNGVSLPNSQCINNLSGSNCEDNRDNCRRRMFFISRIHPKKNVDLILKCWAKLEQEFPAWDLSIVGPDRNNTYADEMKTLAASLKCRRVTFEGELKGDDKYRFMAESDCEVLPTHSENFGMVVAESLACGTPVICSQGAPWKGLNTEKCGWWVPTTEMAFENAMR